MLCSSLRVRIALLPLCLVSACGGAATGGGSSDGASSDNISNASSNGAASEASPTESKTSQDGVGAEDSVDRAGEGGMPASNGSEASDPAASGALEPQQGEGTGSAAMQPAEGTDAQGGESGTGGAADGAEVGAAAGMGQELPEQPVFDPCDAAPECDAYAQQIAGPEECPVGADCYATTVCSTTIWCAPAPEASCNGYPVCEAGDVEASEPCAEGDGCYTVSLCGSVVTCLPAGDAGTCEPEAEYNRRYVGTSTDQCATLRFTCEENTDAFFDDCGCGCQQMDECPPPEACIPMGRPEPELCFDERCPLSQF